VAKGRLPLRHVPVGAELDFPRMRIDRLAGSSSVAWLEGGSIVWLPPMARRGPSAEMREQVLAASAVGCGGTVSTPPIFSATCCGTS
jgi:hypothetical protein